MEKINGFLEKIRFTNPENGWTIIEFLHKETSKRETATLIQSGLVPGMDLAMEGDWVHDNKYGRQFKVKNFTSSIPSNAYAIEKYLSSGEFGHIGKGWAKKITDKFGEDSLVMLDEEPEKLLELGFPPKHLEQFKREWKEAKDNREILLFFEQLGFSSNLSRKIFEALGSSAIELVKNDPYILSEDISGIGFKQADQVALKLGLPMDSDKRLLSGINHIFKEIQYDGHSYLTEAQILDISKELLGLADKNNDRVLEIINAMIEIGVLIKKDEAIYLKSIYELEMAIVAATRRITKAKINLAYNVDSKVKSQLELSSYQMSDEQIDAVRGIAQSSFSILSGGAGVGKTTTIKFLLQILKSMNLNILFAAPTGRAAQRMSEVINQPAQTIHRLLKWSPEEGGFIHNSKNLLKTDFIVIDETSMVDAHLMKALLEAVETGTQIVFIGDPNQLPSVGMGAILESFIESGVIPVFRLTQIFRQEMDSSIVKSAYEVMTGKLPSLLSPIANPNLVDSKHDALFIDAELAEKEIKQFAKLYRDRIKRVSKLGETKESSMKHTLELPLSEVNFYLKKTSGFSPKEEQSLNDLCMKIRPYSALVEGTDAEDSVIKWYEQFIPLFYGITNIQILSPMRKYNLGTKNLNVKIQAQLNPEAFNKKEIKYGDTIFRENDKVIQLKNDYQKMIFNGDIGVIKEVDVDKKKVSILFDSNPKIVWLERDELEHVDLSYAITIHKSQGSEFDAVIVPVSPQHLHMLNRNLLYTAMTRGKKLIILIGSRMAMNVGVQRSEKSTRQTKLSKLLQEAFLD